MSEKTTTTAPELTEEEKYELELGEQARIASDSWDSVAPGKADNFKESFGRMLGLLKPYETSDHGREDATKNPADRHFFKVPSLRNVAKTAPYFHDGSIKTLPEAVAIMSEYQTPGGKLSEEKVKSIVTFLEALTGDLPTEKIAKPELPPNGPKTPAGDPNFDPSAPPSKAKAPPPK